MSTAEHRALALGLVLAGCRGEMYNQPRYEPLAPSALFLDGASARPLPPGTVPRGLARDDVQLYTGRLPGAPGDVPATSTRRAGTQPGPGAPALEQTLADRPLLPAEQVALAASHAAEGLATTFPFPVTAAVMERGRRRFEIFCAPCHDRLGNGEGMVVQRGFTRPPSLHLPRLRAEPVGHLFDVVTNGFGAMPGYASQVSPRDRWAIIAYVRALQLSQRAALDDVPPAARAELARSEP